MSNSFGFLFGLSILILAMTVSCNISRPSDSFKSLSYTACINTIVKDDSSEALRLTAVEKCAYVLEPSKTQ